MPEFLPFLGTRYNPSQAQIENVTSPPYDVISEDYRNLLYKRDPHNVIRLEWNRDNDPYSSAATFFSEWKREGILKPEVHPTLYVYRQIFQTPDGKEMTRTGVIGRMKLSPYSEKKVLPHERTHAWPKRDRLELMEHTRTNFSPLFGLISDASCLFDRLLEPTTIHAPIADMEEELGSGETIRHILWRMDNQDSIERISNIIRPMTVIIADGHHRYETAVEFHEKHPEILGSGYVMMYLSNLQSEGTVILPTHRLLHDVPNFNQYRLLEQLKERFQLIPFETREEGMAELERDDRAVTLAEFPENPKWMLLRDEFPHERDRVFLAAELIQEEIFIRMLGLSKKAIDERINLLYPHTVRELEEFEEEQSWNAAFLLRAVRSSELQSIVEKGEFMPQKTTYFYPKLLTGLVFHEFEPNNPPKEG